MYDIDTIVHFAAESHVDNSILDPEIFIETNIVGTYTLLECARQVWSSATSPSERLRFHHVSTDEVYGDLELEGEGKDKFTLDTPYNPHSPYSASKAASDHIVASYVHTFGFPATISNCGNNYGPYQHPEKFIPKTILNILNGKKVPIYGDGLNMRNWIHVYDHVEGILSILDRGEVGKKYLLGTDSTLTNISMVNIIHALISEKHDVDSDFIEFVLDRKGHDKRYEIDWSYARQALGWTPTVDLIEGLKNTIDWYELNRDML